MGAQIQEKWEKTKTKTFSIKIKKYYLYVILFSKLNIESEHFNAVNRTKSYHSTLIFLCLRQYLEKRVGTSCPELSTNQLDHLERHLVALVDLMLSPSCATIISHDILLDK